ncbi:TonB family protein [Bacteroides intestinalis]|uniref:TonB family protein n=1 Tax=Bacteroides intestinalis TaxID=329854 RepID=A0A412XTB4_9BACE|nr:M56 family metallopeptidase [Bacteroides intestinalis]RGV48454.1 TonB family protein [Bacteroides intestinalis]RHA61165.1 TonB family protein [Bacteroides intestinalis]
MGIFFVYILKSSVCLVVFYLFYRLLLSRETFHRFNRVALLSILLLSCLLPLVEVTVEEQTEVHQTMMTLEQWLMLADMMNTADVTDLQAEEVTVTWIQVALLVYLAGILLFALRNGYSLLKLGGLLKSGRKENLSEYIDEGEKVTLIVHDRDIAPFSWMKYIVISEKDLDENGREILIHELAHIQNRHSWDLLVADICIFFQWFNPASWLLKQELQNIHEYEADETVIEKGVDAKQYQLLLIKKAVGTRLYSMANSFNHSKLKKRITMMLKEKSNPWAKLKYLYILPVAAIAVTAFARPEISETAEEISAVKVNDLTAIVEAKATKSTEEVVQVATALKDTAKPVEVKYIPVEVTEKLQGTPFYEVVEQMPEYPGGIAASVEYIQKNMRYPEAAEKNGTQGRVTVQFIIDKEGNVTNPKVLRSVDKDLDAEAIRLVGAMPKWKPGMQKGKAVAVKYTLPVVFKLEGGEITSSQLVTERVAGTVSGEAVPLYIVDGKEVPSSIMGALRPESIESMTVLKDKSVTELYGEKGKNGVILITLRDKEYPIVIGSKNTNSTSTTLRVKGTSKSSTLPGVQDVYVNRKKADLGDAIIYVDGVEIESKEVDLGSVVPADRIESISVEKDSNSGKGKIYITTKDKKGAEKTSSKGDMKVEGFVQDKDGEPIVGASVLIEGTHTGSITDVDGRFVLSASKGDKLIVSYINMATAKVKAEPKVIVTLKDE